MNTAKKSFRLLSALLVFSMAAFMISCGDDAETLATADKQSVSSESSSDSYFQDAEDISSSVTFASNTDLGGRTSGLIDERLAGATITLSEGSTETAGTITVDFGTGVTVNGVTRKGKIVITYSGSRRSVESTHSITFVDFYVNDVKIEGTRTVTVTEVTNTSITHLITLTDGQITWPDESYATRTASHSRKWTHNADLDRSNDLVTLLKEGIASGRTREGAEYNMQITKDIVFKASCGIARKFLPAEGEKVLSIGGNSGREIIINYGTGDCDNVITVTINGETKTVTVDRNKG